MSVTAPSRGRSGAWGRTSGLVSVSSPDLARLDTELKDARRSLVKAKRTGNRQVAKAVRDWARSDASRTKGTRSSANAIKGVGTADIARLRVEPGVRTPFAAVAFWGAKRRTGWYARARYKDSRKPQHPHWVGASWKVGVRGEGPYVLNDTIAQRRDDIERLYLIEHEKAIAEWFER